MRTRVVPLGLAAPVAILLAAGVLTAGPTPAPTPVPTLTKEQRIERLENLKRQQAAGTDVAGPLANLHPEGSVSVTWKRDFPATLNSEALRDTRTLKVPVYGKGGPAGCSQKFQLVSATAAYKGHGGALVDLAPKVTLSAKKLFEGRGDPPEFVIVSKENDRLTLDLSGSISVSQWPKKGYAFKGTFTLTKLWALLTPDKWARVEIECS